MLTILSCAIAIIAAVALAFAALSVPGKTAPGLYLGLAVPAAGMIAWTHGSAPLVVWVFQLVIGVGAALWTYPWWRNAAGLWRFGGFWLVVPVWVFGAVAAIFTGQFTVAAQRAVYGGYAVLIALLILGLAWRRRVDVTRGVAAGFLLCLALLLLSGAPEVLAGQRWTVDSPFGAGMESRFWGGPWLGYHPNFIGLTAVMVAMRLGPDKGLPRWLRLASLAAAAGFLLLVESRTAFMVAFAASGIFALGYLGRAGLPRWRPWRWWSTRFARRAVGVAALPLLVSVLMFGVSGGVDLLTKDRYAAQDSGGTQDGFLNRALSGRVDIWAGMLSDYADNTPAEWLLGDTANARGVYYEITDPDHPGFDEQAKHTADNVWVGSLYRGGAAGLLAVVAGMVTIVWRVSRRGAPLWTATAAAGLLLGGLTEDEIAATAPAWLLLCGAELAARLSRDEPCGGREPIRPDSS